MKYLAFAAFFLVGVPGMTLGCLLHPFIPGLLLSALVFSTSLGARVAINFVSMEWYRGPDRGFEITLTDLIALSLVAWLVLTRFSRVKWLPPNSLWLMLFMALGVVSTLMAPKPLFGAFTLLKMARWYLVYWCVHNCVRAGLDRRWIWLGIVGVAAYVTFLALQQKYLFGLYRIRGPFDHSNTVPMYLNMVMPMLLIWSLCDPRMGRAGMLASMGGAFGMVFCVLATQSRFGLVLAGMCLAGSLCYALWRHRGRRALLVSATVLAGTVVGGAMAMDTVIQRFISAPKESEEARDEFNEAARMMLSEKVFGVGLNNFSEVLTNVERYRAHIRVMKNEEQAGVAHHIYLLTAAEMGRIGLAVYLVIALRFLWMALRGSLARRSVEGGLLFGLFLGGVALHLVGLMEWALRITPPTYMFAVTCALVSAWSFQNRAAGRAHARRGPAESADV